LVTELPEHRTDPRTVPELQPEAEAPNPLEPWADLDGIIT
jgi:hypothetical protein